MHGLVRAVYHLRVTIILCSLLLHAPLVLLVGYQLNVPIFGGWRGLYGQPVRPGKA